MPHNRGKYLVPILVLIAVGVVVLAMRETEFSVESLEKCMSEMRASGLDLPCLHEKFERMLEEKPARDIMQDITRVFPGMCHPLGHVLGQATYRKESSVEAAYAACIPTTCASGCLHGVVGEALFTADGTEGSAEEWQHPSWDMIVSEGPRLCEDFHACHALGHLLFRFSGEHDQALLTCDRVAPNENAWSCYLGVFMEEFTDTFLFTTEMAGVTPKTTIWDPGNPLAPCDALEGRYQPSCFYYIFTVRLQESVYADPKTAHASFMHACTRVASASLRAACFSGVGRSIIAPESPDFSVADAFLWCGEAANDADHAACLYGLTSAYATYAINVPAAVAACASTKEPLIRKGCYRGLFDALDRGERGAQESLCAGKYSEECHEALREYRADPTPFVRR